MQLNACWSGHCLNRNQTGYIIRKACLSIQFEPAESSPALYTQFM